MIKKLHIDWSWVWKASKKKKMTTIFLIFEDKITQLLTLEILSHYIHTGDEWIILWCTEACIDNILVPLYFPRLSINSWQYTFNWYLNLINSHLNLTQLYITLQKIKSHNFLVFDKIFVLLFQQNRQIWIYILSKKISLLVWQFNFVFNYPLQQFFTIFIKNKKKSL